MRVHTPGENSRPQQSCGVWTRLRINTTGYAGSASSILVSGYTRNRVDVYVPCYWSVSAAGVETRTDLKPAQNDQNGYAYSIFVVRE